METVETREVTRAELMADLADVVYEIAARYNADVENLLESFSGLFAEACAEFERDGVVEWRGMHLRWIRKPSAVDVLDGLPRWP